jgi:hypothetical protein
VPGISIKILPLNLSSGRKFDWNHHDYEILSTYSVRLPTAALPGKKWGIYREAARGVQNTSSDFTNDSISFWWSGIPTTVML